jgi:adhesin transport system membrane fusion protein
MEGHVSIIGSDSIQEQNGNSFYLVKIDLPMSYISYGSERLNIIPGMVAQVDIITGKRSVIDYIFSPITKVLKTSMREK